MGIMYFLVKIKNSATETNLFFANAFRRKLRHRYLHGWSLNLMLKFSEQNTSVNSLETFTQNWKCLEWRLTKEWKEQFRRQTLVKMDAQISGKIRKTQRLLAEKGTRTIILGDSWEHWCQWWDLADKELRQLSNICSEQTKLYKKIGRLFSSEARIKQYDVEVTLGEIFEPIQRT